MTTSHPAANIVANPSELLAVVRQLEGLSQAAAKTGYLGEPTPLQAVEAGRLAASLQNAAWALYEALVTAGVSCEDPLVLAAIHAHNAAPIAGEVRHG